jgi:hypothetical protein
MLIASLVASVEEHEMVRSANPRATSEWQEAGWFLFVVGVGNGVDVVSIPALRKGTVKKYKHIRSGWGGRGGVGGRQWQWWMAMGASRGVGACSACELRGSATANQSDDADKGA